MGAAAEWTGGVVLKKNEQGMTSMAKIKNVLIVANIKKSRVGPIAEKAQELLKKRGIATFVTNPIYFKLKNNNLLTDFDSHFKYKNYDLIVALGGDGTFLYAARTFQPFHIPMLGINAGRVGFLMDVKPSDMENSLDKVINNKIEIKERILLEITVLRGGKKVFVCPFLNDAVVSKGVLSRMVELSVSIDRDVLSQYRSDGLIISTPTGSTAYSLAAGGPILTPDMEALIITPICPHILGVRPIVTAVDKELKIELIMGETDTTLTIDGQENFNLKIDDIMIIKKMPEGVRVYDMGEKQFFSVLREKLGWHV